MNSSILIRLGNSNFRLRSTNRAALDRLATTFGVVHDPEEIADIELDLDRQLESMTPRPFELVNTNFSAAIDWLLAQALEQQRNELWMDAASLLTDSGKVLLLAGPSQSGKSTLALAMALKRHWRIISEDITFLNEQADQLVSFRAPISLREGGLQELARVGIHPENLIDEQWYWNPALSVSSNVPARPSVIVMLQSFLKLEADTRLQVRAISPSESIRALLPISNGLRLHSGTDRIARLLQGALLFSLSGGSLADRISWMSEFPT